MCDNPDNRRGPSFDPQTGQALDVWGCNHNSAQQIDQTQIANRCILRSFESIKSAIICYINTVSETFRNLNAGVEYHERGKMNVIIESLITAIHQVCGPAHAIDKIPHFHLTVQETDASGNDIHSLGTLDPSSSNLRNYIEDDTATMPNLHPGKLSIIRNCEDYRNGDEILYYYIISFQLLYDNMKSRLAVKLGNSTYGTPVQGDKCLFPILIDKSSCKFQLYEVVSETDDSDWENANDIYKVVHTLLIQNKDLMKFSAEIDKAIARCRTTDRCLAMRKRLLQYI